MTPSARVAAAVDILDAILAGAPVEAELTRWARSNRYAGSSDREVIRDHVYDAVRCRRTLAAFGGAATGRGLMLGMARAFDMDIDDLFSGEGHALDPPTAAESDALRRPLALKRAERFDVPDWLFPMIEASLGPDTDDILSAMQSRAPLHARVNGLRGTRSEALALLTEARIQAQPHPLAKTAVEIVQRTRKVRQSMAYRSGLIEFQDASVQAAVEASAHLAANVRVLDYCAGGGGKALALAPFHPERLIAHDINPRRMTDLPARAQRALAPIQIAQTADLKRLGPFDMVLADVPCSGTGVWRRDPAAKWTLDEVTLARLVNTQRDILDRTKTYLAKRGTLVYMTCSLLGIENDHQIDEFLSRNRDWTCTYRRQFTPLDGGDGFFVAHLTV